MWWKDNDEPRAVQKSVLFSSQIIRMLSAGPAFFISFEIHSRTRTCSFPCPSASHRYAAYRTTDIKRRSRFHFGLVSLIALVLKLLAHMVKGDKVQSTVRELFYIVLLTKGGRGGSIRRHDVKKCRGGICLARLHQEGMRPVMLCSVLTDRWRQ